MGPFSHMMTDTVYLEDKSGNRSGPFKSAIASEKSGKKKAPIFDESLHIVEGYKLIRQLPNGNEETYMIAEADFTSAFGGIPACWDLTLSKSGVLPKGPTPTTINIHNSQGIQIGDHNVQHIANSLIGLLESIDASNEPEAAKKKAKSLIRDVLENPTVAAILGGAAAGVAGLL